MNSQSTIDIFFNTKLVGKIYKANTYMRLQKNGGNILITHKAQVANYKPYVWFE